jgi:hypothetical protein
MEKSISGIQDGKIQIQNPGWKKSRSGIRDGKNQILDPGLNIPDPQHCFTKYVRYLLYNNTRWILSCGEVCVCAGMRESLTEVISKSLSKLATQSEGGETVIDETLLS